LRKCDHAAGATIRLLSKSIIASHHLPLLARVAAAAVQLSAADDVML
jgi:hypothetical protein